MSEHLFSLVPFADSNNNRGLKIAGQIARQANILTVVYQLIGDLNNIVIPVASNPPTRQHELWQNTCFELFVGIKDSPQYWEFNLSPNGDWNIYHFQDYRQGMVEAEEFNSLPFVIEKRCLLAGIEQAELNSVFPPNLAPQLPALQLELALDLSPIITVEQNLEIGVTAVIKFKSKLLTYWALTHPDTEADFHHRDSFIIYLF